MLRFNKSLLLALAIAAALAISACGDEDDDGGGEDETQITEAIELAAASGDPAACTEAQTQKFTEQVGEGTGEEAVKNCEENASDSVADSVEVENIEVDGDAATADAAITGSAFDGQTLSVALIKEGDTWKLDEATGFAVFDRDAFTAAFEEELTADPEVPPEAATCVVEQFGALSDQEIQDFFLGAADSQAEAELFGPCFGGE